TPKKNGGNAELIPQLEILGELERVGAALPDPPRRVGASAKQRFLWHFGDPRPNKWAAGGYSYDGSSNDLDLHRLLRATCYVRRHKNEVLDQLPPKQRPVVPLELTATALRDYRRAQEDIVRFLREHHGRRAELAAL